MIFVDANILLYAEDSASPQHVLAKKWWDDALSGEIPVCVCWPVILAFVRIATNHRVYHKPLTLSQATKKVESWLAQPCVRVVLPTSRHWEILKNLLVKSQAAANLSMDAHLAALSIEHGCKLYSTDSDFARFNGLKWENPLLS